MSITAPPTPDQQAPDGCQGFITNLVLRCGEGDETALGELFDLTFFLVAAAVNRGAVTPAGVEDEVVAAFWRIWHRSADYQPTERGVLAWVFAQALDREDTSAAS